MAGPFETIIVIGRPAAGKSAMMDFLMKMDATTRAMRFHRSSRAG